MMVLAFASGAVVGVLGLVILLRVGVSLNLASCVISLLSLWVSVARLLDIFPHATSFLSEHMALVPVGFAAVGLLAAVMVAVLLPVDHEVSK
jgi:hypothetical protein